MQQDKAELARLNAMISDYQPVSWSVSVRSEHERMLRAQSRKRRQVRQRESTGEKMMMFVVLSAIGLMLLIAASV